MSLISKRKRMQNGLLIFLLLLGLVLMGCRESDRIQNIVYTDDVSEVSPDVQDYEEERDTEDDDEISSDKSESQTNNGQVNNEETTDQAQNGDGDSEAKAGAPQETEEGTAEGNFDGGDNDTEGEGDSTDGDGTSGEDGDSSERMTGITDPDGSVGSGNSSAKVAAGKLDNDPNAREVYDSDGNKVKVPSKVTKIAAPGRIGLIVQMLGGAINGESMLYGTSADFKTNSLALSVFADEGINDVKTLWKTKGMTPMTTENFNKLISVAETMDANNAAAEENGDEITEGLCVIAISGEQTFSDAQIEKLGEAGIGYVTVPGVECSSDLKKTVTILGEIIGDNTKVGGTNGKKLASEWNDWEKNTIKTTSRKNGVTTAMGIDYSLGRSAEYFYDYTERGTTTLYINDWDSDAYVRGKNSNYPLNQKGIAVLNLTNNIFTGMWYMGNGGVIVSDGHPYCTWSAPQTGNTYLRLDPANLDLDKDDFNVGYSSFMCSGMFNSAYTEQVFRLGYAFNLTSTPKYMTSPTTTHLGDSSFNTVVVTSKDLKTKMENSRDASKTGLYSPQFNKYNTDGSNVVADDYKPGQSVITGSYDVIIMPRGIGDWMTGCPESPLLAYWAAYQYHNSYSADEVKSQIKKFYSKFYREDISNTEATKILNGDYGE